MSRKYKNLKVGLITSGIILFAGLALNGYDGTLAKKLDLRENYIKKEDIKDTFATKGDIEILSFQTRLILDHFQIAYEVQPCPKPPCPIVKSRKKAQGIVTGQSVWGYQ